MRSRQEWAFRIRQEVANLASLATANFSGGPKSLEQPSPLTRLPAPGPVIERLKGSPYHARMEALAGEILQHRFPLFDAVLDTGEAIDWRRDYGAGITTGLRYFRFVPYLDRSRVGDHKAIWELNRHQHLVVLAQAFRLSGRREFLQEIESQLVDWLAANPYLRGMNWTSALEVAFRALSWIWVYHLAGAELQLAIRRRFLRALYRHGQYLDHNLSVYFSPNTHLLGEAVALHALGALFPAWPGAARWETSGAALMLEQLERQVRGDGSHFEQSAYYQVYALDMFLFHYAIAKPGAEYGRKMIGMAGYLAALMGPSRTLPLLGDDDGGRLFHPYGPRNRFGRATLATSGVILDEPAWIGAPEELYEQAAWWLGTAALDAGERIRPAVSFQSRLFTDSGLVVMADGDLQIIFDAGPFAQQGGGHSHSDALSLIVRRGAKELLIDPGAYTYVNDERLRNWFRGSAAHNTMRIDGRDQATPTGPFRWADPAEVTLADWITCPEYDYADALCRYGGFLHRRRVMFLKSGLVFVCDQVSGSGTPMLEQFWHFGETTEKTGPGCYDVGQAVLLAIPPDEQAYLAEGGEHGWRSRVFGQKVAAPVLRVWRKTPLPACFGAALDFQTVAASELYLETDDAGGIELILRRGGKVRGSASFPASGLRPESIQWR